jgi:hypothetical protein
VAPFLDVHLTTDILPILRFSLEWAYALVFASLQGYYPRLFYPGLHAVKDRFLSRFEPVYYIKQFSNGGTLLRRHGEDWMLYYRNAANNHTSLLKSYSDRPEFRLVEDDLRLARTRDLQAKG